jgi:hypothetical protein
VEHSTPRLIPRQKCALRFLQALCNIFSRIKILHSGITVRLYNSAALCGRIILIPLQKCALHFLQALFSIFSRIKILNSGITVRSNNSAALCSRII